MNHIYNNKYSASQIIKVKKKLRSQIFFLLLYVDKETKDSFPNIDVCKAFDNILYKLGGLNELLYEPQELVVVMALLQSAKSEYLSDNFNYSRYRSLVLNAGAEINKIKEV